MVILFLLLTFVSCKTGTTKDQGGDVLSYGSIDKSLKGDLSGDYSLDSLYSLENLYALGALKDLSGEIQIFDGQDFSSVVQNDSVLVGPFSQENAAFVVYAQVKNWKDIAVPLSVTNTEALIGFFEYNENAEMNTDKPFMFLLEGRVEQLNWHVLYNAAADTLPVPKDHHHNAISGSILEKDVEILGVYSRDHEGVYTHHGIPIHMHFRTMDGMLAGHVDDLELGPDMNLKIPPGN